MNRAIALSCITLLLSCANVSHADDLTAFAIKSGWYSETGSRGSSNFIIGRDGGAPFQSLFRDYFVFIIPALTDPISSAELYVRNPDDGYASPDPFEVITFFDITTKQGLDIGAGSGLDVAMYDDLGSGIEYGSKQVSAADNGQFISIPLNSAALAELNASKGGFWAIGGSMTTQDQPLGTLEVVFAHTGTNNTHKQLILHTVPEPTAVTSASAAMAMLTLFELNRWRRRKVAGPYSPNELP